MLETIIVFVILAIALYLSIPRHDLLSKSRRVEPSHSIQKAEMAGDDKEKIVMAAYYANERAHQTNHAAKCQALAELAYMHRNPIDYGASLQLQSGEIIDAEVNDVAGLLEDCTR